MQTLETLRKQIDSAHQLQSVISTMKALAVVNIRQYDAAVASLAEYSDTVEWGLQIVLRHRQGRIAEGEIAETRTLGVIVFGSEQGLAGQFNERIAQHAFQRMRRLGDDRLVLCAGERVAHRLEDRSQSIEDILPMPGSLVGITRNVQNILLKIEAWRWERNIDRIVLFYNSPISSASYEPRGQWLLPLDFGWLRRLRDRKWDSRSLPIVRDDWHTLTAALIREYIFVALYRAYAESLASENASRLQAMQSAEKNIDNRLDELNSRYQHLRQSSITEEILEIASGYEALGGVER